MRLLLLIVALLVCGPSRGQDGAREVRLLFFDFDIDARLSADLSQTLPLLVAAPMEGAVRGLRILERKELIKLYKDRSDAGKLPALYDDSTAIQIGRIAEANFGVLGRVYVVDGDTTIITRLVDISTTDIVVLSNTKWTQGNLIDSLSSVSREMIDGIKSQLEPYFIAQIEGERSFSDFQIAIVNITTKFEDNPESLVAEPYAIDDCGGLNLPNEYCNDSSNITFGRPADSVMLCQQHFIKETSDGWQYHCLSGAMSELCMGSYRDYRSDLKEILARDWVLTQDVIYTRGEEEVSGKIVYSKQVASDTLTVEVSGCGGMGFVQTIIQRR